MIRFILLGTLFSTTAIAHGHHHHHESDGSAYAEAAAEHFYLKTGPLMRGSTSYVLLPDGTKYPLDSRFFHALQKLEQTLEHDDGEPTSVPAPWQRIADFAEEALTKPFWVNAAGGGIDYLLRYGPMTASMIAVAEVIEHFFWPAPGACVAIQSGCAFAGKHTTRFMNLVINRYPANRPLLSRIGLSVKQLRWNFKFWREMGDVMQSEKLVTSKRESKEAQYYLAQEKAAFLLLQLTAAKDAIEPFVENRAAIYLSLRTELAWLGKAIDRYSIYMAGLALHGQPIEDSVTRRLDQKFQKYFSDWNEFLSEIKRGSMPLTSALGKAIWGMPHQLLLEIRTLQKGDCEEVLTSDFGAE